MTLMHSELRVLKSVHCHYHTVKAQPPMVTSILSVSMLFILFLVILLSCDTSRQQLLSLFSSQFPSPSDPLVPDLLPHLQSPPRKEQATQGYQLNTAQDTIRPRDNKIKAGQGNPVGGKEQANKSETLLLPLPGIPLTTQSQQP